MIYYFFFALTPVLYWIIINVELLAEIKYYPYMQGESSLPLYERWRKIIRFGNRSSFKMVFIGTVFFVPTICAFFSWCACKIHKEKEPT